MRRFIPKSTLSILQLLTVGFVPLLIIPVIKLTEGTLLIVLLIVIGVIWTADILLFILSFILLWNVPIIIGEEGIIAKRKTFYWRDVVSVKLIRKWKSIYGFLYTRVEITLNNGVKLRFEPSESICKCIHDTCCDSSFIRVFDSCLKNIE